MFRKKIKQILTIVLCVVLTVSCLGMVSAAEKDAEVHKETFVYSDEYLALKNFGLTINYDEADATVSMLDFYKTSLSLIGIDTKATSDDDVIRTAIELGYVKNVNAFQKLPHSAISYGEAIYGLVNVLGYGSFASVSGGYPSGHLNYAQKCDLLDGISSVETAQVLDAAFVTKLFYNACNADYNRKVSISETEIEYIADRTILDVIHSIKRMSGVVTETNKTWLNVGKKSANSYIAVDSVRMRNEQLNVDPYIGTSVYAWYKEDGSDKTLLALISRNKNEILNVSSENIDPSTSLSKFVYDENGKTKTVELPHDIAVIYNGVARADFTAKTFCPQNGSVKLIYGTDGKCSIIVIEEYRTEWVNYIDMDKRWISTIYGKVLELKPGDVYDSVEIFDENGKAMYFNEIRDDNVLMIAESANGSNCKVIVSKASVTGTVEGRSDDGDSTEYLIAGAWYKESPTYRNLTISGKSVLSVGSSGTFFLDAYGNIAGVRTDSSVSEKIGYLISAEAAKSGLSNPQAKILDSNGKITIYSFADKVKIDSQVAVSGNDIIAKFKEPSTSKIKRQLMIYNLNADGEINKVDLAYTDDPLPGESKDSLQCTFAFADEDDQVYWKESSDSFDARIAVGKNLMVFTVPPKTETSPKDKDFFAGGRELLTNSAVYYVDAYKLGSGYETDFLVVYADPALTYHRIIFESATVALNEDGNEGICIHGCGFSGDRCDFFVNSDYALTTGFTNMKIAESYGDVMDVGLNVDGEVADIRLLFDYSKGKAVKSFISPSFIYGGVDEATNNVKDLYSQYALEETRVTLASAVSYDGDILKCVLGTNAETPYQPGGGHRNYVPEYYKPTRYPKIIVVDKPNAGRKNRVRVGSVNDIRTHELYGDDYSLILQSNYYNDLNGIVVFNY